MDTYKLTTKSRDAVSAAVRNALTNGNPSAEPVHLLHALLMVPDNTVGTPAERRRRRPQGGGRRRAGLDHQAAQRVRLLGQPAGMSGSLARVLADAETRAEQLGDEFVATEHLMIALASVVSRRTEDSRPVRGRGEEAHPGVQRRPRQQADHLRRGGGRRVHPRQVLDRPHRARPRGQARPGDRPRLRDPPGGAGVGPAHQEQPRPDR